MGKEESTPENFRKASEESMPPVQRESERGIQAEESRLRVQLHLQQVILELKEQVRQLLEAVLKLHESANKLTENIFQKGGI